jgi:hypothetical protein
MSTAAELVLAVVAFSGLFALGVLSIARPRKVSRFFRIAGSPLYGPRFAAKLFAISNIRYTGFTFVILVPFMAWAAIARILG